MHGCDWPWSCRGRGSCVSGSKTSSEFEFYTKREKRQEMDPKPVFMFGILLLGTAVGGSAAPSVFTVKDGNPVNIACKVPDAGPTVVWFRVPDGANLEYIASVSGMNPAVKKRGPSFDSFSDEKLYSSHTLVLKSFNRRLDAGLYTCVSLKQDMKFGPVTRLQPEETGGGAPTTPKTTTTESPENKSTTSCTCPTHTESGDPTQCSLLILAPLAGGCGLLLLTLLCTVLYCNSVRTRRCPHHYKRKPRAPPGKQLMTNARV